MAGVNPKDKPVELVDVLDVSDEEASALLVKQSDEVQLSEQAVDPPPAKSRVEQAKEDCAIEKVKLYHTMWKLLIITVLTVVMLAVAAWGLMSIIILYMAFTMPTWIAANPVFMGIYSSIFSLGIGTWLPKIWEQMKDHYENSTK